MSIIGIAKLHQNITTALKDNTKNGETKPHLTVSSQPNFSDPKIAMI